MASSKPALTLPMASPAAGLVTGNVGYSSTSSSLHGAIDRLSAVPSSGMVRDPEPKLIVFDIDKEETRPKRVSSIGASLRRLFSKSPAKERSSSDTQGSIQGPETPESAPIVTGQRGRTPPRLTTSSLSVDSVKSSTSPPDNQFYIPPKVQRALSDRNIGGVNTTQSQLFQPSSIRAAMASHRGIDDGQRWTTADRRPPAAGIDIRSHEKGEILSGEIQHSVAPSHAVSFANAGNVHSLVQSSSRVSHTGESIPVRSVSDQKDESPYQQFRAVGAPASESSGTKDAADLPRTTRQRKLWYITRYQRARGTSQSR